MEGQTLKGRRCAPQNLNKKSQLKILTENHATSRVA